MANTALSSWDQADMHRVFDGVLIRSAMEFRRALRVLRRYDAAGGSEYVEHMRRGLRAIEAELGRRGIEVGAISEEPPIPAGARSAALPMRPRPHERGAIPPPRARQPRKSV